MDFMKILNAPHEDIKKLSDSDIIDFKYAIENYSFTAAGIKPSSQNLENMSYLENRLATIQKNDSPKQTDVLVKCSCGHSVSRALVMSSSNGPSCPDCYDRMSV